MHSVLSRQLKRLGLSEQAVPPTAEVWQQLLARVSQSYIEADQGRIMLERSIEISSAEMQSLLDQLRVESAKRLEGEQAQSKTLINSALDAIIGIDQEGRIIEWNRQAVETFGWSRQEALGQLMAETIIPEKDRATLNQGFKLFFETGEAATLNRRLEIWVLHRDGHSFPIEIAIIPVYKDDVYQFYGFIRDITERQRADQQFQLVVESAPSGMLMTDSEGKIVLANRLIEVLFGYTREELLGQTVELLIPKRFRRHHRTYRAGFFMQPKPRHMRSGGHLLGLRKDDTEFPIEIGLNPLVTDQGTYVLAAIMDISERRKVEAQMALVTKDLERNNQELSIARDDALAAAKVKSEFLATMSHEIRTPMNGVIGMTGLLMETELDSQQRQFAETVQSSSEALLTIINDILDFSKIEAGKLEFEIIDFDLRVAMEEALELLAEKAGEKHLELVGLISGNVPTALRGDPGRLRQVLLNLASNAIKFTESGEVVVKIHLLEETSDEVCLRLEVVDTGIGIPADVQDRLFEPFSQADSSTTRRFGGTGLGLAISRQLIELMQGEIGVDSVANQGSTFWFTIRLSKQLTSVQLGSESATQLQGLRLCCVDDHMSNLELLSQYAADWGMESLVASTPAEALSILQEGVTANKPVDLAIIDTDMPGMDGLALARVIKADPKLESIRLVLLTSFGHRGDLDKAREAGFSGYLRKPIRKAQLFECLHAIVNDCQPENTQHVSSSSFITLQSARDVPKQARQRVLVADDHRVNQQLAVLMLERLGYRADVVANGCEAVEAMERVPYSLIFMDCQMPEMDGFDATREIRRREAEGAKRESFDELRHNGRMPIIAMTANAMQGDRDRCLDAGMDDYLAKPIKSNLLEAILAKWLPIEASDQLDPVSTPSETTNVRAPHVAQHPSGASSLPAVDSRVLAEWREMGGQEFISRMVDQFVSDAMACVVALEYAIQQNDLARIHEIAHGLKGICRNMGAGSLGEICLFFEHTRLPGEQGQLVDTFGDLQAEFQRVCDALKKEQVP